jgi:Protein of unknown function (DUF2568)
VESYSCAQTASCEREAKPSLARACSARRVAYWDWNPHTVPKHWAWALALPAVAAVLWATLRTPGDGPDPVVAINGPLRLALELGIVCGAAVALYAAKRHTLALAMAALIAVDYALSYDRVARLLGL